MDIGKRIRKSELQRYLIQRAKRQHSQLNNVVAPVLQPSTDVCFNSSVETSTPLYKYLEPQWADEMMRRGSIKIGTFREYRLQEGEDIERGDAGEGTLEIHSDPGPCIINGPDELPEFMRDGIIMQEGSKLITDGPYELVRKTQVGDAYVYCVTDAFNENVMYSFGGACIRINDHYEFFAAISNELYWMRHNSKPMIAMGILARCVYSERRLHYKSSLPAPIPLIKPPKYEHQREVRAIWQATSLPIRPIYLQCPELTCYCTRIR